MNGYAIIKFPENKIYRGQMNNGKMEGSVNSVGVWKKNILDIIKTIKEMDLVYFYGVFLLLRKVKNLTIKGYIGFWNEGNMNGVGLKIGDGKFRKY